MRHVTVRCLFEWLILTLTPGPTPRATPLKWVKASAQMCGPIDYLTAALRLLLPARGRHRAPEPTAPTPPPDPFSIPHVYARFWPRYHGARPAIFDEHGLALVRPYFIAHEQWVEREQKNERRTAAALAGCGIEYDLALVAA